MKKTIIALLALILALSLVSCSSSGNKDTVKDDTPAVTDTDSAADTTDETADTPEDKSETETTEEPDQITVPDSKDGEFLQYEYDNAVMLIDHDVEELYTLIGQPNDTSYASSCIGSGEDGELYYNGFIVVTYRENGTETVVDVYMD